MRPHAHSRVTMRARLSGDIPALVESWREHEVLLQPVFEQISPTTRGIVRSRRSYICLQKALGS